MMLYTCCNSAKPEFNPNTLPNQDCVNHFLNEFGMVKYENQTIPCTTSYLVMFEHNESSFAVLHNDCADLVPQLLVDCNGNELCLTSEMGCFEMIQDATRIGIIGVAE